MLGRGWKCWLNPLLSNKHGHWAPEISSALPEKTLILIIFKKLLWMFHQSVVTSILFYTAAHRRGTSPGWTYWSGRPALRLGWSQTLWWEQQRRELWTNVWPLCMMPAILCTLSSVDSETCSATGWQTIDLYNSTLHTTTPSFRGSGERSEEVEYKTWLGEGCSHESVLGIPSFIILYLTSLARCIKGKDVIFPSTSQWLILKLTF